MSYGVANNVLKTDGVIVSTKWPCATPPILVWTEDALMFIILGSSEMVSYVRIPTIDWME